MPCLSTILSFRVDHRRVMTLWQWGAGHSGHPGHQVGPWKLYTLHNWLYHISYISVIYQLYINYISVIYQLYMSYIPSKTPTGVWVIVIIIIIHRFTPLGWWGDSPRYEAWVPGDNVLANMAWDNFIRPKLGTSLAIFSMTYGLFNDFVVHYNFFKHHLVGDSLWVHQYWRTWRSSEVGQSIFGILQWNLWIAKSIELKHLYGAHAVACCWTLGDSVCQLLSAASLFAKILRLLPLSRLWYR